jgi:carboxylesterase type B
VDKLLELYPNDPTLGSPYNTGNVTFPALGVQYKRMAAMTGDYSMTAGTRFNAQTSVAHKRKVWAYRFDMQPPSNKISTGVTHGIELDLPFRLPETKYTTEQVKVGQFMSRSFISFVADLDPNHTGLKSFPSWPSYKNGAKNMVFANKTHLEKDNYREAAIEFINTHLLQFVA